MIQGTTPTFTFKIKDNTVDLSEATNVYVTLAQGIKLIEKQGSDLQIDGATVSVWLTQEESLKLTEGINVEVQVNWTYSDGDQLRRAATVVKSISVNKQLLKRVIE